MGFALVDAGAWQRSVNWIEATLPMIEELRRFPGAAPGFDLEEARMRCSLAKAYEVIDRRPRARRELDAAVEIYRRLGDSRGLATAAIQQGRLELMDGRYSEAVRDARRGLAMLSDPDNDAEETVMAVQALSTVAYAHQQLEDLEEALAGYERILELAWQVNDQRHMNFAYCNRAEIRWRLGDHRPVEEDLRRAIAGWEQARDRIPGTADQRAEFLAVQEAAYDRLIHYLAETSRGVEAFEIVERFRARSFLEMLDHPTLLAMGERLPAQWKRRQELIDEVGRVRLLLEDESDPTSEHRHLLDRLEGELQEVETRLVRDGHELAEAPAPPTLEAVQAGLEPGEVLVSYRLTDERVLAWAVFENDVRFVQIPVTRQDVERRVGAYLEPLRHPRRAEDAALQGREADHLAVGRELYRWLVGALPREVREARRLIVVPDGVLHYLPFESLVIGCGGEVGPATIHGAYRACRYLGLEKPLVYSSSAGALLSLRQRRRERQAGEAGERELLAFAPQFGPVGDPEVRVAELTGPELPASRC